MSNTPILLPQNPTEGEIFNVTAHRKLVFTEGRWKLHTNNLVITDDSSYALNPFVSLSEPLTSIPERFWYEPVNSIMHYKHTTAGGVVWRALTDEDNAAVVTGGNIDLTLGEIFVINVTAPTVLTVQNAKAAPLVSSFVAEINNGASNPVTWFDGVKWDKGVPPTLTAGVDIIGFYSRDGGTTWRGFEMAMDSK